MAMYTCTKCEIEQSWNPLTDGICDKCWEEKNALVEKLLMAVEAVGIEFMKGTEAEYGDMPPLYENVLMEHVDDIADLFIRVKKENV